MKEVTLEKAKLVSKKINELKIDLNTLDCTIMQSVILESLFLYGTPEPKRAIRIPLNLFNEIVIQTRNQYLKELAELELELENI